MWKQFEGYLGRTLYFLGITRIVADLNRRKGRIPILMYHKVRENGIGDGCLAHLGMVVSYATLRKHLTYVRKHYQVVSLHDFITYTHGGDQLPPNALILTFDDGFEDNYAFAVPLLEELQMTASFFVVGKTLEEGREPWHHRLYRLLDSCALQQRPFRYSTPGASQVTYSVHPWSKMDLARRLKGDFINLPEEIRDAILAQAEKQMEVEGAVLAAEQYMSQSHLEELQRRGFEIGAHSMHHDELSRLDGTKLRDDLHRCKAVLSNLGTEGPLSFAYPFGTTKAIGTLAPSMLEEAGFGCGLTTVEKLNDRKTPLFQLGRIEIGEIGIAEFAAHASGTIALIKSLAKSALGKSIR
jgi:peptidoglycan/xylan/chitin deacetylase (PgdA/CDA1 family)